MRRAGLVVAYDVTDDRRRRIVAKALEKLGERIQYSVFWVESRDVRGVAAVVAPLIEDREDRVLVQHVCGACARKAARLGLARRTLLPAGYRIV